MDDVLCNFSKKKLLTLPVARVFGQVGLRALLQFFKLYTLTRIRLSDDHMTGYTLHSISYYIIYISPVLSKYPLHTNSGCGKERRILIGPW